MPDSASDSTGDPGSKPASGAPPKRPLTDGWLDPDDSEDDSSEALLETILPLRLEETTPAQRNLMRRLARQRVRTSPALRSRSRLLKGFAVLLTLGLVLPGLWTMFQFGRGCWTFAAACAAIFLTTGVIALLYQRLIHRPAQWSLEPWRCPACGYDLQGLVLRATLLCPECGKRCEVEDRRRLVLDTETVLAEARASSHDLAWAMRRSPDMASVPARECEALLERAVSESKLSWRGRLLSAALIIAEYLAVIAGVGLVLVGVRSWASEGALGAAALALVASGSLLVCSAALLLLRAPLPRRARMATIISSGLRQQNSGEVAAQRAADGAQHRRAAP
jgi:hypothetical protein